MKFDPRLEIEMPCPFCGSLAKTEWAGASEDGFMDDDDGMAITCQSRRCRARGPIRKSQKGAIKAWQALLVARETGQQ